LLRECAVVKNADSFHFHGALRMTARHAPALVPPSVEQKLQRARVAGNDELRRLARGYDWAVAPEAVLGWMMAQKGMDLSSALVVFFNGEPERLNYLSKREVPHGLRGAARVLDTICLRLNSGFYRPRMGQKPPSRARLDTWLDCQRADRDAGQRGRWILDEALIEVALRGRPCPAVAAVPPEIAAIRRAAVPGTALGTRLRAILGQLR